MSSKKNMQRIIGFFLGLVATQAEASPSLCHYVLDPKSVVTQWTAFKTTQKIAVTGSFAQTRLVEVAKSPAPSRMDRLLRSLQAEIDLAPDQIKTGNPARDQTLFQSFFGLIEGKKIKAKVETAKLDRSSETAGNLGLRISIGKKSRRVPFRFELKGQDLLATGSLDVLDFGLKTPFDRLHQACELLHTGPDGVSKTWTQVEVHITAKLDRNCS